MNRSTLLLPLAAACAFCLPAHAGRLIAVDSGRNLYEIDAATGAKTLLVQVSANAGTTAGLARNSLNGTIYLTSTGNDSVFSLDITTGTATLIGAYGDTTLVMHGIEWDDSTSTLYGASNGNLYTIDQVTGHATLVGTSGLTSFTNLGYDSTTNVLYATNSTTDSYYLVDRATGAMTLIGALGSGSTNPNALAYDPDHHVMYMLDNNVDDLFTIDPTTGAATLIGSNGAGNLLGLVYLPDPNPGQVFCAGDGSGTACPCGNNSTLGAGEGCLNSLATAGSLRATGTASLAADTLTLHGSGMPNGAALYFQGTTQAGAGAGAAFGDGLRCAGGSIVRLKPVTNVGGVSQYPQAGDPSVSVKGMIAAPGLREYQIWYRNAVAFCTPSTFNLTNGLEISWTP